ncbi:hypothetical protein ACN429_24455 (plasmid) [Pseudomonas oryzihabitans]|uniref:hypothetical protein n=1 Tax=Pseudomonas oryzihabitans TaxID=47885 RepID=UPI003B2111F7
MKGKRREKLSVSATELSKLGHCEVMIALRLADDPIRNQKEAALGNAEHDRFHLRAVLNMGTTEEFERLNNSVPHKRR